MPRAKKQQASLFDAEIEDEELERLLAREVDLAPEATAYRKVRKDIRKQLEDHHDDAMTTDEQKSGWVRCGSFRFNARKAHRDAGSVNIGEGEDFKLAVERLD